jgi:monoamine oxidase
MARSELLSKIQSALRAAIFLNKNEHISYEEYTEIRKQKTASRRTFLKTSAVAAGGLLLPSGFVYAREKLAPKVVVVGAGISGLNAAYKLKKAGIPSQVFEATKRAGGRIRTVKNFVSPGSTTEFGAEFIDSGHADMHALVKEFGFDLVDVLRPGERDYRDTFNFGGRFYSEKEMIEAMKPFAGELNRDFGYAETGNMEKLNHLDKLSIAEYLRMVGINGWLYTLLDAAYCTDFGDDIDRQSAINFIDFAKYSKNKEFMLFGESDERFKIKGGNQRIVDELHHRVNEQVHLEKVLEAVTSNGSGYRLSFQNPNGSVSEVQADYLIMAIPLSILKQIAFKVDLTPGKVKAIKEIPMGKNDKFFAVFKDKPWRKMKLNGNLYTDEFWQCSWDHTRSQKIDNAGYTFFLGGSRTTMVKKTAEQTQSLVDGLDKIYHGVKAGYTGKRNYSHWCDSPYTKGSYSVFLKGQALGLAEELRKPERNIFFAGEQTSAEDNGYMNGGAETGRAAAEAVVKRIKSLR